MLFLIILPLLFCFKHKDTFSVYKADITCNLNSEFYKCKSDLYKIIDTCNRAYEFRKCLSDSNHVFSMEIVINDTKLQFKTINGVADYLITKKSNSQIDFESTWRSTAEAVSVCNRQRFNYYMKIDSLTKSIICYYDSKFEKTPLLVFTGKINSQYSQ